MDQRKLIRESKGSPSLQKRLVARRREEPAPDLTDFMNDMFFGGPVVVDKKTYNLTGGGGGGGRGRVVDDDDEDDGFDDSTRSNSARLTQEWLQEARRVVASSPTRCDSPGRRVGSPRFAAPAQPSSFDRKDNSLSRSARRYRTVEGISDEILSKSAKHSRNKSDTFAQPSPSTDGDESPATAVHRWFSNILKPTNNTPDTPPSPEPTLPPRQPPYRRSRFQTEPSAAPAPHPQGIQVPSRRTFKSNSMPSPENPNRHTLPVPLPLSPPRNLVESAQRRTITSATCSQEKVELRYVTKGEEVVVITKDNSNSNNLNRFLKEQRILLERIFNGELHANAKVVLSGPFNSTTSMVAAICYAWLLGYRQRENESECVVVPVMNVKRSSMWKLKQTAWLFHNAGLDTRALLFSDEVDMESLLVTGQLSILVVGKDVLSTTVEVGSQCTVLTDNYCEDAYDLLQNPVLKKLLLAGILLDTQNIKASASISMTRDAEAVQLLLVGSAPNYRYTLFDQLIQDQNSTSFVEALNHNYGMPPNENDQNSEGNLEHKVCERKSSSASERESIRSSSKTNSMDSKGAKTNKVSPKAVKVISPPLQSPSPAPAQAEKEASRGKNKTFFLAKWFGFGSK